MSCLFIKYNVYHTVQAIIHETVMYNSVVIIYIKRPSLRLQSHQDEKEEYLFASVYMNKQFSKNI